MAVKIKINSGKVLLGYKINTTIKSGVFVKQERQIALNSGNSVQIKTITSVLLKSRTKTRKSGKFLRIYLVYPKSDSKMSEDQQQEAPDQSHLFDESTVPLIDIASSISSNEEVATAENENDLEKDRENPEVESTTSDHGPAMIMTMRPVEAEEEVIDLSSDDEPEDPVISNIYKTHIQPKLTTSTSKKFLDESLGGLNVISKAIKKGKIWVNRSPSPKKNSGSESSGISPSDLRHAIHRQKLLEVQRKNSGSESSGISPSDLRHAINRQKQLEQQKKLAKKEQKARKKSFQKETKRRAKASNKRIERAEMALNAPVATLHPAAPSTSTPNRVVADQLREDLRYVVQGDSTFFNFNGQPRLSPGSWPDTLSWSQTKRAHRRNYKKATENHPEVAAEMFDPEAFPDDSPRQEMNDPEVAEPEVAYPEVAEPEVAEPEVETITVGAGEEEDDDEEVVVPSLEELLANPTPSTSRGVQNHPNRPEMKRFEKIPFPNRRMGSLLTYGRKLFTQGASIDELIDQTIDDLANRRAARELLESGDIDEDIGARRLTGAHRVITTQIANLIDRLKYLIGRRNRLLETLVSQQDQLDDFANNGADKPQRFEFKGKLPDPVNFWHGMTVHGVPDPEMPVLNEQEPEIDPEAEPEVEPEVEPETEVSHYSSNLSEEGICAPGHCTCIDKKCEDYNYTN